MGEKFEQQEQPPQQDKGNLEKKVVAETQQSLQNLKDSILQEGSNSLLQTIDGIASENNQIENKESLGDKVRNHLKNKEFGKAITIILEILFTGKGGLEFTSFTGKGFKEFKKEDLEKVFAKESDESKNITILYLQKHIRETNDINKKLSYGFMLTQIKDYFITKSLENKQKPHDFELLAPRLKIGSIICMRQNRNNENLITKIGDSGLINNDNKTIADFTHSAVITSLEPNPMITHATLNKGVHTKPLKDYLANFSQTNIVMMDPNNENLGNAMKNACIAKNGMSYDKGAAVEQFLGGIQVAKFLPTKDDSNKTNCVEFIADALFGIDNSQISLKDKSHPNDLLEASNNTYTLSYVKTYSS